MVNFPQVLKHFAEFCQVLYKCNTLQVAVRHSQGREPKPLFVLGQNEVSHMAATWKPALASIKPPGALNKTGRESEPQDEALGQEQLLLSRLHGASKGSVGAVPSHVLLCRHLCKDILRGRTGSSNTLEKEGKFSFLQPNRKVFWGCWGCCLLSVLDSGTKHAGHTVPTAGLFLWWKLLLLLQCFSGETLLRCRSLTFGTLGLIYPMWWWFKLQLWGGTGMFFCQRTWRTGFSKSGAGRIGEMNTNPE